MFLSRNGTEQYFYYAKMVSGSCRFVGKKSRNRSKTGSNTIIFHDGSTFQVKLKLYLCYMQHAYWLMEV